MTEQEKQAIDSMEMEELLRKNRFAPIGDPFWQGEHGDYAYARLIELRHQHPKEFVKASKEMGW